MISPRGGSCPRADARAAASCRGSPVAWWACHAREAFAQEPAAAGRDMIQFSFNFWPYRRGAPRRDVLMALLSQIAFAAALAVMVPWGDVMTAVPSVILVALLLVRGERGQYPFVSRHLVVAPVSWGTAVALLVPIAFVAAVRAVVSGISVASVVPAAAVVLYLEAARRRGLRIATAAEQAAAADPAPPAPAPTVDERYAVWTLIGSCIVLLPGVFRFGLSLRGDERGTFHFFVLVFLLGFFEQAEEGRRYPFAAPQRFASRAVALGWLTVFIEVTVLGLFSPAPPGYPTDSPLWLLVPVAAFVAASWWRGLTIWPPASRPEDRAPGSGPPTKGTDEGN